MPITVAVRLPATFYFSKRFPPWPSTAEGTVPYPVGCTGTSARYAATSPVYCGDAQQTASNRVLILPHFPLRVRGLSGTQCWLRAQPSCGGFFRTAVWFAGSRRGAIGFPSGYKSPVSCVFVAGGSTSHASERHSRTIPLGRGNAPGLRWPRGGRTARRCALASRCPVHPK